MKINSNYKIRNVAGESLILLQGKNGGDLTRVVSLNPTALSLWNSFLNKDFSAEDIKQFLMESFSVSEETAQADAEKWIAQMSETGLIVAE